jgi:hypothetical protein
MIFFPEMAPLIFFAMHHLCQILAYSAAIVVRREISVIGGLSVNAAVSLNCHANRPNWHLAKNSYRNHAVLLTT